MKNNILVRPISKDTITEMYPKKNNQMPKRDDIIHQLLEEKKFARAELANAKKKQAGTEKELAETKENLAVMEAELKQAQDVLLHFHEQNESLLTVLTETEKEEFANMGDPEVVAIDYIGPTDEDWEDNNFLLDTLDLGTNYPKVEATKVEVSSV